MSPFRALTVALAGTLGVGNIVGVASALYLGGPGAVLWMLVSALVAMVLKYAEITLAVRHRRYGPDGQPEGGAPYYMEDGLAAAGLPRFGKVFAGLFALLCLLNAVTMGSLLQVNAAAGAMEEGFGVPPLLTGGLIALCAVAAALGGALRISALTEKLVPFMTLGFLAVCAAVLVLRRERIPSALASVWTGAWDPAAAGAGFLGFLTAKSIRYGVMRGLVSNEAGCGTAPIAHAAAQTDSPARQGIFGLAEVFVDTVLLCSVTALCILVSDSGPGAFGDDAVRTAQTAFSSVLGDWAGWFFALSVLLFGVATVLCWAHYGMVCLRYLTARRRESRLPAILYAGLLAAATAAGAVSSPRLAWLLADGAIALMTLCNLAVLLLMHKEVEEETERLFPRHGQSVKRISWEGKPPRKE